MKTWRLVAGILSIVLSVFVLFQSCAAGVANTMLATESLTGSAGAIVAILMLSGGIVSIATRRGGKGGAVAVFVLFGLATFLGFSFADATYPDLYVWSVWCLINTFIAVFSGGKGKKPKENEDK